MNILVKIMLILIISVLAVFLFVQTSTFDNSLPSISTIVNENQNEIHDEENGNERIYIIEGYKAIRLDDEVLRISGIKLAQPERRTFKPEYSAYADVVNIDPLISARTEYLNLLAEHKSLHIDLQNHHQILNRAEALHRTNSLTTRELEQIRADYELKLSRSNAMKTRMEGFIYQLKSEWGEVIVNLVLDQEKQTELDKLTSLHASLVLVSLLKNRTLTDTQQQVFISRTNQRNTALLARYLDQARHIRNPFYGESHFYYLNMENPGAGSSLYAWIEEYGESINGIFIPDQAVVWYANDPWIYTMHDTNLFVRIPVVNARKVTGGWLLEESLINDAMIVTSGSQTLLSEEFKWAIPDEDAD